MLMIFKYTAYRHDGSFVKDVSQGGDLNRSPIMLHRENLESQFSLGWDMGAAAAKAHFVSHRCHHGRILAAVPVEWQLLGTR